MSVFAWIPDPVGSILQPLPGSHQQSVGSVRDPSHLFLMVCFVILSLSLFSHFLNPSRRLPPQTQLAITMTNQPKYLHPSMFTLGPPTARFKFLFFYAPLCIGHWICSQTIIITLLNKP